MTPSLRRGLPRVSGGEAWPPEGTPTPPTEFVPQRLETSAPTAAAPAASAASAQPAVAAERGTSARTPSSPPAHPGETFRRGLPRIAGGEPWPSADAAPAGLAAAVSSPPAAQASPAAPAEQASVQPAAAETTPSEEAAPAPAPALAPEHAPSATDGGEARRGLPRVAGGEPWPPQGTLVANAFTAAQQPEPRTEPDAEEPKAPEPQPMRKPLGAPAPARQEGAPQESAAPAPEAPAPSTPPISPTPSATPATPTATPAAAKRADPTPKAEPKKYGLFTIKQWVGAGAVIALAIVGAVTLVVLAARWFVDLEFMTSFLAKYPGEYDLPESAPVGFPGWLGWQHFFNVCLIVLIIRSGYLVRKQERPEAFWASKKNPKKISIQLWFHQGLNILWVVNGAIFII